MTTSTVCYYQLVIIPQVLGTPEALNFLHILQNLVLLERGSAQSAIVWPLLDDIVQAAVVIRDEKSADNFHDKSLAKLKEALEGVKNDSQSVPAPPPVGAPPPPPPPPPSLPGESGLEFTNS